MRKPWFIRRWSLTWIGFHRGINIYEQTNGCYLMRGYIGSKLVEIVNYPGFATKQGAKRAIDKWVTRLTGVAYPPRRWP